MNNRYKMDKNENIDTFLPYQSLKQLRKCQGKRYNEKGKKK